LIPSGFNGVAVEFLDDIISKVEELLVVLYFLAVLQQVLLHFAVYLPKFGLLARRLALRLRLFCPVTHQENLPLAAIAMKLIKVSFLRARYLGLSRPPQPHFLCIASLPQLEADDVGVAGLAGPQPVDVLVVMDELILELDVQVQLAVMNLEEAVLSGEWGTFWGCCGRRQRMERFR
jgi:hypothetical protein